MDFCSCTQHLAILLVLWSFAAFETLSMMDQQCKEESSVVPSLIRYKKSKGSNDVDTRVAAFRSRLTNYKSRIYNEIKWGRILTAGISSVCQLKMLALHAARNDLDLSSVGSTWTVLRGQHLKTAVTQLSNEMTYKSLNGISKYMPRVQVSQSAKDKHVYAFYEFTLRKAVPQMLRGEMESALGESMQIIELLLEIGSGFKKTKVIVNEIFVSLDKVGSKAGEAKQLLKKFGSEIEIFSQIWTSLIQMEQFDQLNLKLLNNYLLKQYTNLLELIDLPKTTINETVRETIFETKMYPFEHPIAMNFIKHIRLLLAKHILNQVLNGALVSAKTDVGPLVLLQDAVKNENVKINLTKNCEEDIKSVEESVEGWDTTLQKLLERSVEGMKRNFIDFRKY